MTGLARGTAAITLLFPAWGLCQPVALHSGPCGPVGGWQPVALPPPTPCPCQGLRDPHRASKVALT